jgi:hypothetical protein
MEEGVDKLGVTRPLRGGRPRGSSHRAPLPLPPPSSPHPDGTSPQSERLPHDEWAKATPSPSWPALRVVPVDSSGGGMARMGGGEAATLGLGGALEPP